MSKRYGRQQKRKARKLIENLKLELSYRNETIDTAKSIVRIAKDICPNSICFKEDKIQKGTRRYPLYPELSSRVISDCSRPAELVNIRTIDLYQMETDLRKSRFDEMIHFEVDLRCDYKDSKRVAYAISAEGLKYVPIEYMAKKISRELAEYLKRI